MSHYDARSYNPRASIGYLMRRGATLMREQLEQALARQGFTFAQWVTLAMLRDDEALTPADMCRELHHDSGAFTRILDQLEERGFLKRQRSDADRRVVQLRLTTAGRRIFDMLMPVVVERHNSAMEGFTAAEVAELTALLGRLIARLEAQTAAAPAPALQGTVRR